MPQMRRPVTSMGPMETYKLNFPGVFKAAKKAKNFTKKAARISVDQVKSDYHKSAKSISRAMAASKKSATSAKRAMPGGCKNAGKQPAKGQKWRCQK